MNTTDSNSNKLNLQDLHQRKNVLEMKRIKWTGILIALLFVPLAVESFLDHFLTEDAVTRIMVILFIFTLLFLGYFAVKITKWTWAVNDVEREIKKVEKLKTDNSEKKKQACGFFSTHHHTWTEKVAKVVGVIALLVILSLSTIKLLGDFDLIQYDFPQLFKVNYPLFIFTSLWTGSCSLRYRSDLSLVSRICHWSTIILFFASLPLLYMEYKIGGWMLLLAFTLSVINLFRFEKEVYFLKQDDMDNCISVH